MAAKIPRRPGKPAKLILKAQGGKVSLTVIEQVVITISGAVDAKGNPVPVPTFSAPPAWSEDNTAAGTLTVAADGMSAVFAASAIGSVNIKATGQEAGGGSISGSVQETVTAAAAAALVLSVATPTVQQPAPPPPPPPPGS